MKKVILAIIFVILLACTIAGTLFYRYFSREIPPGPPVRSLARIEASLNKLVATDPKMSLSSLGEFSYDGEKMSLWLLSHAPQGEIKHRVLLTGCMHGNEPASARFLLQFCETLRQPDAYPGVAFDVVPLVNPWGWEHNARRNGEHKDLNRDFNSFKARESVLMRDLFKKNKYDLIIDFHEDSGSDGFYFYRLDNPDEALCKKIVAREKADGHDIHSGRVMMIFKAIEGIITSGHWDLVLARAVRQFSMTNYFRLEGCPQVFLFETPSRLPMEERMEMDRTGLDVLLKNL